MIDICLYILAGSVRLSMLVAGGTVALWWFLSDYYMPRDYPLWTEFMDAFAFVPASFALLCLVTFVCRWRVKRCVNSAAPPLALASDAFEFEVEAIHRISRELRTRPDLSAAARFLGWHTDRIAALLPLQPRITARQVARCWWATPQAAARVWLLSLWLPLLWIALVLVPRYTNLTEQLAAFQSPPPEIFDVIVSGLEPTPPGAGAPERLTESIWSVRKGDLQRIRTALVASGYIDTRVTAHPRVYRRIKAICTGASPRCAVGREALTVGREAEVPVRAGLTRVYFIQTKFESRLGLRLWVFTWDGGLLDEVAIEP